MGGLGGCRACWADGPRRGICRRCPRRRFATGGRRGAAMATDMVTTSARSEVLRRIREAKGGAASAEAVRRGWSAIERRYRREATRPREAVLELLEDRLRDYDAGGVRAGR